MKDLIAFLNSQESNISSFNAIHIGFFESDKGISCYVTGASEGSLDSDDHCSNELFPLAPNRYWAMEPSKADPFEFVEMVKKELKNAIEEKKISDSYQEAKLLTLGWDDGDLEYVKGGSSI